MSSPMTTFEQHEYFDAFRTYQIFDGVRCHFNYDKYNWEDYGPNQKLKLEKFFEHKHRYHYLKLHRRFKGRDGDLIAHLVGNFRLNKKFFITNALSKKAFANAQEYILENENFEVNFKNWVETNLMQIVMQNHPVTSFRELITPRTGEDTWLMLAISAERLPMWLVVGLDKMINFRVLYNKTYPDHFIWADMSKTIFKMTPFFVFDTDDTKSWFVDWLKKNGLN